MPEEQRPPVPTSALLVIERGKNPYDSISKTLDKRFDQLVAFYNGDEALADRMKWVALHALAHPKLADKLMRSDLATVLEALRESATLGLLPIPATAEGYLVPRWNKDKRLYDITFMAGYRGYVKLMYQSPRVAKVAAGVACEHDEFEYEISEGYVRHVPRLSERGKIVGVWAKGVIITEGHRETHAIIMDEDHIAKVMRSSASRDSDGHLVGPWVDWPEQMRMKTAVRELRKLMPMSYAAEEAYRLENEQEERYQRLLVPPRATKQDRLRQRVMDRLPGGSGEDENGETATGTGEEANGQGEGNGEAPERSGAGGLDASDEEAVWKDIDEKDTSQAQDATASGTYEAGKAKESPRSGRRQSRGNASR